LCPRKKANNFSRILSIAAPDGFWNIHEKCNNPLNAFQGKILLAGQQQQQQQTDKNLDLWGGGRTGPPQKTWVWLIVGDGDF
jgi:hypothetical protein